MFFTIFETKMIRHESRTTSSGNLGGAHGVMVIVVESGHGDTSSNPG